MTPARGLVEDDVPVRAGSKALAGPVGAAILALLYVLGGVSPWWLLPLMVAAVAVGWSGASLRWGLAATGVAVVAGAVLALSGTALLSDVLIGAARGLFAGVLPWLVIAAWRARREIEMNAASEVLRAQELREQQLESELARERLRLAEHLHDDLGHALSLVALNLGRLELDDDLTAPTRDAIGIARSQVGVAVERLGASVETLRATPAMATSVTLDPTGPDVAELIGDARRAGADVTVSGLEALEAAASVVAALAASVIREGLTNAMRHAPSQPIEIRLQSDSVLLTVTMTNPVPTMPGRKPRTRGTGLDSLTARLRAAEGSLHVDPRDGQFSLTAQIPRILPVGAAPTRASTDPPAAHGLLAGLGHARRRGTALVGAAIAVPAVVLGVVTAGLALANSHEASRALLPAHQFAQIRVGDTRADVIVLLPEHTLPRPQGARPGCDYYALTSNPFADGFEDALEICWDGDVVTSAARAPGAAR